MEQYLEIDLLQRIRFRWARRVGTLSWDDCSYKKRHQRACFLALTFLLVRASEKAEFCKTERETSARPDRASTLILEFQPPRALPGERGSIAPSASRRTAHPGSTSPAARAPKGEVSLSPAAEAAHAPPGGSRRLLQATAVTGAGPRASWGPRTGAGTCQPGRETKAG